MPASQQEKAPQVQKKGFFTVKTLLIILLILVIAGMGVGGYIYMKTSENQNKSTGPDPDKLVAFSMGSLLVNLADSGGNNFMRLTPVLEYEQNNENKNLGEELTKNKEALKFNIIRVIRTKKLADVQPPDSIDKIAEELKVEINKNLREGKVYRVYFSEYLTQ